MLEDEWLLLPYPQQVRRVVGELRLTSEGDLPLEHHITDDVAHREGYRLTISAEGIELEAATEAGLFYGEQTLQQLIKQFGRELPQLEIDDWPDFDQRGFMLDISRNKVPTMPELFDLVDQLASWKINQLQLYTEHTFAYSEHEIAWRDASPMTAAQIQELDVYCRVRFIEMVPNQNSFGHMHQWLKHEPYKYLAEAPDGCETSWGWREAYGLTPSAESLTFLHGLYDELLPNFSSKQFNVGCDETIDLGKGRSKARAEVEGIGSVYLDFLLQIYADVKARGLTMQFWSDIVMNYPELVPHLPKDMVAMEWGYEADHPFAGRGRILAESGLPFVFCSGTSSWRAIVPRYRNAMENMRSAVSNGRLFGAQGVLITDWGDEGHWQPFSAAWMQIAIGAALAWAHETNDDDDVLLLAASLHIYGDSTGETALFLRDLGNVDLALDRPMCNSTILFNSLQADREKILEYAGDMEDLLPRIEVALERIRQVRAGLLDAPIGRPDGDLIQTEFFWAADMLSHACRRIQWAAGLRDSTELAPEAAELIEQFEKIWHARNRPGGFADSLARMQKMAASYE